MYRLPGLPTTDLAATLAVRALHTAVTPLPQAWRDGPALTAAKQRLGLD
jgi:hypothetical protein